jgi:hypothetical protein
MQLRRASDIIDQYEEGIATAKYKAYDPSFVPMAELSYQASEIINRTTEEGNTIQCLMVALEMHDIQMQQIGTRIKKLAMGIKQDDTTKDTSQH